MAGRLSCRNPHEHPEGEYGREQCDHRERVRSGDLHSAASISRIANAASRLIAFRSGRYAERSCGTCVTPPGPLGSLASTSFRLTLATSGARLVSATGLIGAASAPNSAK